MEIAMPDAESVRSQPKSVEKPRPPIRYPESDGEPMAETPVHWHASVDLAHALHVR